MGTLSKVLGFSLSLTLVFTLVANLLPQVEGEAPKEERVDLGTLDMDSFIALGETIFSGKGTCALCHNNMGRAPDLLVMDVVATAAERLADSRYQGAASDGENYLRESLINPGIYVVAGFGKKGTNDTESPMPDVSVAPIQLSELEIDAVIAYLQAKDGNEVTVALPTEAPAAAVAAEEPAAAAPAVAETAEAAMVKFGCAACHTIFDTQSPVGPDLNTVGNRLSREEIRQSIVDPMAVISDGFAPIMPATLADQMMVKELEMLVDFLAEQKQ